jgi:hypothetical protein
MEVNNSFLHRDIPEVIYMEQPQGFMQDSSLIFQLKKSLYGLKKALRAWYAKMDTYLLSQNFLHCKLDPNVYMLRTTDSLLLLVLYVDDLLITGCSTSAIATVKRILHDRFLMMNMGPLHFFLGLEISQDASGIKLSQAKYAKDLLERFHMIDYKSASTPFLSGVKLEDGGETPLVDNTLYRHLVGSISHTPDQTSHMELAQFPGSCRSCMSYIGKLQSVSFDTYRAPSPLGFIMQQTLH